MTAHDDSWDSDPATPPDGDAWDLVVLGGGTAGIVAARTAAGFGATTLLIEAQRPGGDCLWTGCVPSKTLLASAHAAHLTRTATRYGIHSSVISVDFAAAMTRVRNVVSTIEPIDSPETLRAGGVRLARARAKFARPDAIVLESGEQISFRQALMATGARPSIPPIPGLAEVSPLTSDTIWNLNELPQRLVVLGGGAIGCELAQAFARLGSIVDLIEAAPRLLPREDPVVSTLLHDALSADGVRIHLGTRVGSVHHNEHHATVSASTGLSFDADEILVAVGRQPNTDDAGLDAAGVETGPAGHVLVDPRLRTSNRRIWAAGDVTSHPQFTHVAGVHGSLAASNAVLGLRRRVDLDHIPRVIYTRPEVAAFGAATHEPVAGNTLSSLDYRDVDRAVAEGKEIGVSKMVFDPKGRLVGATLVGARAGDLIGELVLASRERLRAGDIAGTMHAYPGYSDAVWKPAIASVRERLTAPAPAWAIQRLASWQRLKYRMSRTGVAAKQRKPNH